MSDELQLGLEPLYACSVEGCEYDDFCRSRTCAGSRSTGAKVGRGADDAEVVSEKLSQRMKDYSIEIRSFRSQAQEPVHQGT